MRLGANLAATCDFSWQVALAANLPQIVDVWLPHVRPQQEIKGVRTTSDGAFLNCPSTASACGPSDTTAAKMLDGER